MSRALLAASRWVERNGLPRPWQCWLLLLTLQAVAVLGPMEYFYRVSHLALPMHLVLLTFAVLGLSLLLAPIRRYAALHRVLVVVLLTLVETALLLVYALNFMGHKFVGAPIEWEMALAYAGQLRPLLQASGVSASAVLLMLAALVAASALGINRLFRADPQTRTSAMGTPLAVVALALVSLYGLTRAHWLTREPVHVIFHGPEFTGGPKGMFDYSLPRAQPRFPAFDKTRLRPRPLVLITVDALRSSSMQVYGNPTANTPFLQSLLASGKLHRVDHAKSICTVSYCGIMGVLASRYWTQLTRPPDTLPDALAQLGYRNHFLLSGDHTNFYGLRRQYGENIALYSDGSMEPNEYLNDDRLIHRWLADLKVDDPSQSFLYVHLMSVHEAGLRLPGYHAQVVDSKVGSHRKIDWYDVGAYEQRYHDGILQADDHIRKIFDWMHRQGWLDDVLVVVTADHGEYLGEFNRLHHGGPPFEPVIDIPLLVYDARTAHWPPRPVASQVDVAATMLNAIGAPTPVGWSGVPLQMRTERCAVAINSHEADGVVGMLDGRMLKALRINGGPARHRVLDLSRSEDGQAGVDDPDLVRRLQACVDQR